MTGSAGVRHTFRYRAEASLEPGAIVVLDDGDAHHLTRVVRRREGDPVELFDPSGEVWAAVVARADPPVQLRVLQALGAGPALVPVDLYLGVGDWGRFDRVVTELTEIGVASITVMSTERGHGRGGQDAFDRRRVRVVRLIDAAGQQCGRAARPALRGLVPFSAVMAEIDTARAYLVDPRGDAGLGDAVRRSAIERATILVGPAAGFAEGEVQAARAAGVAVCRLGEATLRAETAAVVATTLAADALGHVGGAA